MRYALHAASTTRWLSRSHEELVVLQQHAVLVRRADCNYGCLVLLRETPGYVIEIVTAYTVPRLTALTRDWGERTRRVVRTARSANVAQESLQQIIGTRAFSALSQYVRDHHAPTACDDVLLSVLEARSTSSAS